HILGLIAPQIVGTALGFIATTLTGGTYSPIDIIAKYAPSAGVAFFGQFLLSWQQLAQTSLEMFLQQLTQ
ncbi:MAG: hypothetical protein QXP23_04715, partial [Fervidicoccaceae archaeon]